MLRLQKKCGALTLQQTRDLKLRMSQVKPLDYWKNSRFQVARQDFAGHHQNPKMPLGILFEENAIFIEFFKIQEKRLKKTL